MKAMELTQQEKEMLGFVEQPTSTETTSYAPRDKEAKYARPVVVLTDPLVGMFVEVNGEFGMVDGFYPNNPGDKKYGFVTSTKDTWTGRMVRKEDIKELGNTERARAASQQYYIWEADHLRRRLAMNFAGDNRELIKARLGECEAWEEKIRTA